MTINELRDFIFENYYKKNTKKTVTIQRNIRKKKDLQLFATKLTEKTPDSGNAK